MKLFAFCVALCIACAARAGAEPAAAPVQNFVELGVQAADRGDLKLAIRYFTRAMQQVPGDPAPWYNRALAYSRMGETAAALADAEQAVKIEPALDEGHALIARLDEELGRLDPALASIDRALRLKPREELYHLRRAELLLLLNRGGEAATEYTAVLDTNPHSTRALHGLAEIRLAEHRDREALLLLRRYVVLAPNDADVNVAAAGLLVQAGRPDDALAWIAAHPSADPRMTDFKVSALLQLARTADAAAALPAAAPGDSPFRAALRGQLAFAAGRCRDAEDAYRLAASAVDASALDWRNLGSAGACARDYETAVAALSRAINLNPTDALAHRYRADAYRALGNRRAAVADASEALRLVGPDADLLMMLGVDEYLLGSHADGRRDYARGCALLDPSQTEKRRLCAEQLPKMTERRNATTK